MPVTVAAAVVADVVVEVVAIGAGAAVMHKQWSSDPPNASAQVHA